MTESHLRYASERHFMEGVSFGSNSNDELYPFETNSVFSLAFYKGSNHNKMTLPLTTL